MEESLQDVIAQIEAAFTDAPRPADAELLHPECRDDMDLQRLREFGHWSDVPGDVVVLEYAALAFLSPLGFRHFIPVYMIWVLRHPEAPDAVVDSTIWALHPNMYGDPLDAFTRSKWSLLDAAQRGAVGAFLRAMIPYHSDAEGALSGWRRVAGPT